jgi:hypothetical protein
MPVKLNSTGGGSVTLDVGSTASNFTQTLPSGTGAIVVAGQNSAITSGTAVASTSGTSIDFTGIPSWAKKITVIYSGVSVNAIATLLIQIGDSGGIETTGYNSTFGDTNSSTSGFLISASNAATAFCTGKLELSLLNGNTWVANGVNVLINNSAFSSAGDKTLSATLDRVRFTTVAGTGAFDAGTINILYE